MAELLELGGVEIWQFGLVGGVVLLELDLKEKAFGLGLHCNKI